MVFITRNKQKTSTKYFFLYHRDKSRYAILNGKTKANKSCLTQTFEKIERESKNEQQLCNNYPFGSNKEYSIRLASTINDKIKAWQLVYKIYIEKEYAKPDKHQLWYNIHDSNPDNTTFLVEKEGKTLATVTAVPDSPMGLPADDLFYNEINTMRMNGRQPCEIISLANSIENMRQGMEIMKNLFRMVHVSAESKHITDLVLTVNPKHVSFYKKILLMEQVGKERSYEKVAGAPAVLLRLNLETAAQCYLEKYGDKPGSLYQFFFDTYERTEILNTVLTEKTVINKDLFREFFMEKKTLFQSSRSAVKNYLQDYYQL